MNRAAAMARGELLLFLHADTLLPDGFAEELLGVLARPGIVAGAFRLGIAHASLSLRLLCRLVNLRSSIFQLPYGDQALFLNRSVFERFGGFPETPIMEDYILIRKLRQHGRIGICKSAVVTSDRRWKKLGVARTTAVNQLMIAGFHFGIDMGRLARFYRKRR